MGIIISIVCMVVQQEEMYTLTDLKKRGWTQKLISTFVPTPDETRRNPLYRSAPPMKLYLKNRIESIENSEEYREMWKKVQSAKRASKKGVDTKRQKLIDLVSKVKITVDLDSNVLINAIDSYNEFQSAKEWRGYSVRYASVNSDSSFLQRIQVNYIRHNLTQYDEYVDDLYRRVGKHEAYRLLKNRTLSEIAKVYPHLYDECNNQMIDEEIDCDLDYGRLIRDAQVRMMPTTPP